MGLTNKTYQKLSNLIDNLENPNQLDLLELGIQEFFGDLNFKYLKNILRDKFNTYISLDLHDIEGVTKFDLSNFDKDAFKVDIITNFGTTEHVEYEKGQYNCWKNIHEWLKVGGIMIHELPEYGSWKNHCRYYTTFNFFKSLEKCGYKILELENNHGPNGNLNWAVLKKIVHENFLTYDEFYENMLFDSNVNMSIIDSLNNPKNLK